MTTLNRDDDGKLPAFAWPGGYPIYYVTRDGGELCPKCANGENGSEAAESHDDAQWELAGQGLHWEGDPLMCAHCGSEIESAYGAIEDGAR